jgi:microcin C transport system substrate-binding protein
MAPYVKNLAKLGIKADYRTIDPALYSDRVKNFDFDMVVNVYGQSQSPGNEQRNFWGSASADENGSRNYIGIKNPAIDKLIDKIIFAENRTELVAATHALDRVLLWNHYVVPQWFIPYARVAHWDRLGRPEKLPSQSVGFPNVWWWNDKAAKKLAAKK